jgi:CelD/BcsL family acetyltransferase involved in cellulose biosynthesis
LLASLTIDSRGAELVEDDADQLALGAAEACDDVFHAVVDIEIDRQDHDQAVGDTDQLAIWRVFSRNAGAAFRIIGDVDEALAVLDTTDAQQQERMQQLGLPFNLNDGTCSKFYRDLVRRGLAEGYVIVSALTCGKAIVATVLGIRQGNSFVFLRISNAGKKWSSCSPSRLIIERTMAALHRDGVRNFDLSIGNYAFKRRFGAAPLPLTDVSVALGWRGIPYALRDRAAQQLRRLPWLAEQVGRLRGKRTAFEEG